MSTEIPDDKVLREATINLAELYIVYVFSCPPVRLLTLWAVPSSECQIKILQLQLRVLPSSVPLRSLVPLRKGVFHSHVCCNWSSISHRTFLFPGVFVHHPKEVRLIPPITVCPARRLHQ